MARPGFTQNRKACRAEVLLRDVFARHQIPEGLAKIVLRGSIELIWDSAYQAGDAHVGDALDVAAVTGWPLPVGELVEVLVRCGGDGAGLLEESPDRPNHFQIHDLYDHCPDYVRKRSARERERLARRTSDRSAAGHHPVSDQSATGQGPDGDQTVTRTPSPSPSPKKQETTLAHPSERDAAFDAFWAAYPRKRSKGDALKAWKALKPVNGTVPAIMAGLQRALKSTDWARDGGKFIPYPATWLRGMGWEDELEGEDPDLPTSPAEDLAHSARVDAHVKDFMEHGHHPRWSEYTPAINRNEWDPRDGFVAWLVANPSEEVRA